MGALGSLVWLFAAHRELWAENQKLRQQLSEQDGMILTLSKELEHRPTNFSEVLKDFQDQVLTEVPFEGNRIPPSAWLTPGLDEPDRRPEENA